MHKAPKSSGYMVCSRNIRCHVCSRNICCHEGLSQRKLGGSNTGRHQDCVGTQHECVSCMAPSNLLHTRYSPSFELSMHSKPGRTMRLPLACSLSTGTMCLLALHCGGLHVALQVLQRCLNARQFGLKMIANVSYGYTSASFSGRMPMAELADAIVQVCTAAGTPAATSKFAGQQCLGTLSLWAGQHSTAPSMRIRMSM